MANIEALRQLRRVLLAVPDDRLHMAVFVEEATCGTARCLFGWAAVDPWFREHTPIGAVLLLVGPASDPVPFRVATEVFAIGETDADNLFGAGLAPSGIDRHAVTKDEVLWNIDRLLAGRPALPYAATEADVPLYADDVENYAYIAPHDEDADDEGANEDDRWTLS